MKAEAGGRCWRSVSRVGGKAQAQALRAAAQTLRLDYAQFLELEMFTRFGGMPDTRVRDKLTRGAPNSRHFRPATTCTAQSGRRDSAHPRRAVGPAGSAYSGGCRQFPARTRAALDRAAPAIVRRIHDEGSLDDAAMQELREMLRGYARELERRRRDRGLADVRAHIDNVRQLGAIVNAMRGIAAARAQQARGHLVAVDAYAETIARAIGSALGLSPDLVSDLRPRTGGPALILFCAEQGFAGAYSERVLDAVQAELATCQLFLVGDRGAAVAAERGVAAGWQGPMPSHAPGVAKFADRLVEAVFAEIAAGKIDVLDAIFNQRRPARACRSNGAGCSRWIWRDLHYPDSRTLHWLI